MCRRGCCRSLLRRGATLSLIPQVLHLHTYFMFPISIDQNAVMDEHRKIWAGAWTLVRETRPVGYPARSAGISGGSHSVGGWKRQSESSSSFSMTPSFRAWNSASVRVYRNSRRCLRKSRDRLSRPPHTLGPCRGRNPRRENRRWLRTPSAFLHRCRISAKPSSRGMG
jgi:hypothetical protein